MGSNAQITLEVLPPRKGKIRVAYDGDGLWAVRCDYFHGGVWIYDQGLMTTEHVKKLTGKSLEIPKDAMELTDDEAKSELAAAGFDVPAHEERMERKFAEFREIAHKKAGA